MSALLLTACGFVVGVVVGGAFGTYANELRRDDRHRSDVARNWREGRQFGFKEGYRRGWTAGRAEMVGEETSRRLHPTQHPFAQALNVVDLEQRRIDRERGN